MIERLTCLLLGLFPATLLPGQIDTTLEVTTVVVTARTASEPRAGQTSVADALATEGVYVKNYGPGSVATVSVRGASAAQTLVRWNGIPLQNPSLGLLDLSTLALEMTDEVRVRKTGAIGGTVDLSNGAGDQPSGLVSRTTLGSFGHRQQALRGRWKQGRWTAVSRAEFLESENDYDFLPAPGVDRKKLTNAAFRRRNFQQDVFHANGLAAHYWFSDADRYLPPTTYQRRSSAYQNDRAHRIALSYRPVLSPTEQTTPRTEWQPEFRLGFLDELLDYFDPTQGIESRSGFRTAVGKASLLRTGQRYRRLRLATEAHHTVASVSGPYPDGRSQNRYGLRAGYHWFTGPLKVDAGLDHAWQDGTPTGLLPSLTIDYTAGNNYQLLARAARNYRFPTLNDRYWLPGGNRNLLAETAWSADVEARCFWAGVYASATVFTRRTTDYIQWARLPEDAFWSARNLNEVASRGLELRLRWALARWQLKGGYDYVRSVSDGEQLLYTPEHLGFVSLNYAGRHLDATLHHRWVGGSRGVNDDPTAHRVAELRAGYRLHNYRLFGAVNNLFDVDYQIVERRPLPGRHFRIGLEIALQPTKKPL